MSKYFYISTGLRGCYMPDSSYVLRADSRRELKAALADECRNLDGYHFNHSDVARVAANAWREAHKPNPSVYDFVIPYGATRARSDRPFGVFASVATRAAFEEYTDSEGY